MATVLELPCAQFVPEEVGACPQFHSFVATWPLTVQMQGVSDFRYYHQRLAAALESQVGTGEWYSWILLRASSQAVADMLRADQRTRAPDRQAQIDTMEGSWWVLLWQPRRPETERKSKNDLRRTLEACTWCPHGATDFQPMVPAAVRERWAVWSVKGADAYHVICLSIPAQIFSTDVSRAPDPPTSSSHESLCMQDLLSPGEEAPQGVLRRFLDGTPARPGPGAFLRAHPLFTGLDCRDLALAAQIVRAGVVCSPERPVASIATAPDQTHGRETCRHTLLTRKRWCEVADQTKCALCQDPLPVRESSRDDPVWCARCALPVCATCVRAAVVDESCEHDWCTLGRELCSACGERCCLDQRGLRLPTWMTECPHHGEDALPLCRLEGPCAAGEATRWCRTCGVLACCECIARLANQRLLASLLEKAAVNRQLSASRGSSSPAALEDLPTAAPIDDDLATSHAVAALYPRAEDRNPTDAPEGAREGTLRPRARRVFGAECAQRQRSGFELMGCLLHPTQRGFAISCRRVSSASVNSRSWLQHVCAHILLSDSVVKLRLRGRRGLRAGEEQAGAPDGERNGAERLDILHYLLDALVLLRHALVFDIDEHLRPQTLAEVCEEAMDVRASAGHRQPLRSSFCRRVRQWSRERACCPECGALCDWPALRVAWTEHRHIVTTSLIRAALPCNCNSRRTNEDASQRRCANAQCLATGTLTRTCVWPGPDPNKQKSLSSRLAAACEGGQRELWATLCSSCGSPLRSERRYEAEDLFGTSAMHARVQLSSSAHLRRSTDIEKSTADAGSLCGQASAGPANSE